MKMYKNEGAGRQAKGQTERDVNLDEMDKRPHCVAYKKLSTFNDEPSKLARNAQIKHKGTTSRGSWLERGQGRRRDPGHARLAETSK